MLPIHALMLKEWISMYRKQAPETQNMDILVEYEKALTAAYGLNIDNMPSVGSFFAAVITSYSIHYTKLYDLYPENLTLSLRL